MYRRDRYAIFMVIFLVLGIALSLQVRSILYTRRQEPTVDNNIDRMKTQLSEEQRTGAMLKQAIADMEKKKEAYLKETNDDMTLAGLNKELDRLQFIIGLTDVKGPGIILAMNDAEKVGSGEPEDYVIHYSDILDVVNDLRAAGAQAISINNERLIATSEQVCAGPTIKINKNRYAVPYEIKAIGDPSVLSGALTERIAEFKQSNLRIDLKTSKEIEIPKYNNKINDLYTNLEVAGK